MGLELLRVRFRGSYSSEEVGEVFLSDTFFSDTFLRYGLIKFRFCSSHSSYGRLAEDGYVLVLSNTERLLKSPLVDL